MTRFEELSKQIGANAGTVTPMPSYRCHKEVWALKIKDIVRESLPGLEGRYLQGMLRIWKRMWTLRAL